MAADSSIFEVFCKTIAVLLSAAFLGLLAYKVRLAFGSRCPGCGESARLGDDSCPKCGRRL